MDSLLKHMVDMTGHRDHAMLDLSAVAAVQELAGAQHTRVLSLAAVGPARYLRARASVDDGGAPRLEDEAGPGETLEAYPELAACLAAQGARAEAEQAGRHTMWVPIWRGELAATILEIARAAPFTAAEIHTIDGIVGVYRNFRNLLEYSERDSLTGLLNRKTFDDQLARMLQCAAEQESPLPGQPERRQKGTGHEQWLAVVDVDHFKLVNDRFGHLYGDEVLILIANMLQSSFRAHDRVFRFGGEEFVVLLRSTTLENARRIIERFRAGVENHHFPQVGTVTVSVGFTCIKPYDSPVVTLGHADQALYFAKTHGRNQVCHYDQLVADGLLATVASNDTAEFF
ncbi:GGDEF domain-containing protein [Massilia solisilvae]|uniref:diguanylate cyclase n=1 Tax=Massilia solisilvae TaxID=1811225 RepID=A0ABT2BNH6_9BURK|nr:GGDEF domain-containing protein [Massilia solisilvae]MCS0610025.1 GGDEF domain-containing protein [Massilia solisilvae]